MAKAATAPRAPRGTRTLTQAFFSAAEEVPEGQRDAIIKAAVAAIRDSLKQAREKAKAARDKAKAGKPAARRRAVASSRPNKHTAVKGRKIGATRRGRPPAQQRSGASAKAE
jgi:hypothetical protein